MLLEIHPKNPDQRKVQQVVECLRKGGVIIYPTDTIYGLGCSIEHAEAINRICRIKKILPEKALLSFICSDLSHLSQFTKSINTPTFRVLNANLPGPFTFILEASREVPKLLMRPKSTVGIRVPNHPICKLLLKEFGHPIISTSLPDGGDHEDVVDPEVIYHKYSHLIDAMVSSGPGGIETSTIVDCVDNNFSIIRQGKGELLL